MNIVMLYLEPSIRDLVREILKWEGYAMESTPDVEVTLQALEEYEGRSLLLMDNYHVSPAAEAALRAWRHQRFPALVTPAARLLSQAICDDTWSIEWSNGDNR